VSIGCSLYYCLQCNASGSTVGEEKAKVIMCKISPVARQHIIFTGRYHFKDKRDLLDLDKLIELLEEKLKKSM
jgi:hypothetical protein